MIKLSDIESMSKTERLLAIDLIWSTLSDPDKEITSPAWHGDVISARMEKVNSGHAKYLTIEQLKIRLNKKST